MFRRTRNFFRPMNRTLWVALAGLGIFLVSVLTMAPLRMWKEPVENYNLFYVPILALLVVALLYRCCVEEDETKGYLYGYFAALFAWPLIGEVSTIPVQKGVITLFSDVNIKLLGGYYYLIFSWLFLFIFWTTGALKKSVCCFFLTFFCIWTFELYMDNYSSKVPIPLMWAIGNAIAAVFTILSLIILWLSRRTESLAQKTLLGCILYITISLVMMGAGQWKNPSKFYVKYEAGHIDHEIEELQAEKEHLEYLKWYMIYNGLAKADEFPVTSDNHAAQPELHEEAQH